MRIKKLEKQMFDLGEDFSEAVNQSSETWHDNAPFDAVRDRQAILNYELTKLRATRKETVKVPHKVTKKIGVGSKIIVSGSTELRIMIGGSWIGRESVDGYTLITCDAPIAERLLGKKVGDEIEFPKGTGKVGVIS